MKDISRKWVREWPVASIITQLGIGRFLAYLGCEEKGNLTGSYLRSGVKFDYKV